MQPMKIHIIDNKRGVIDEHDMIVKDPAALFEKGANPSSKVEIPKPSFLNQPIQGRKNNLQQLQLISG